MTIQTTPGRTRRWVTAAVAGVTAALLAGCAAPSAATVAPPVAPAPAAATGELTREDLDSWLDGMVPANIDLNGIAGATVTVVRDGEILTARGYGHSDLAARTPVDVDETLFRPGSVSKVFTATAVMQLVGEGRIDLDADISAYLDFEVPRRFDEPITVRNLLTHTAGFEEAIDGLIGLGEHGAELREDLASDPPEQVFRPGTTPSYSNYGYGLAGYVVERVSGLPFADYVQQNVMQRAGMTSSTFAQPMPPQLRDRLSEAYLTVEQPAQPFEVVSPAPAGALAASTTDMARFMISYLDGALLDPATAELMQQPGLGADTLGPIAQGPRMALGLFDESRNGRTILGHGGDTQFFHSHMQLYPQERTGVFVSVNSSGRDGYETFALRMDLMRGFTDRYFPAEPAAQQPVAPTAVEHAAAAAGTYESARAPFSNFLTAMNLMGQTTIADNGDGTITMTPGPLSPHPMRLQEVAPWLWQEVGGDRVVAMRPGGAGVEAVTSDSAFTLLPTGTARDSALVLPALIASAVILLLAVLVGPVGALLRRRYRAPARPATSRLETIARRSTRVAAALAVLALIGWGGIVVTLLGLQDVPDGVIRAVQVVQGLALLGLIPAVVSLVTGLRHRLGVLTVGGRLLVALAFIGLLWPVVAFSMLSPSISY